MALFPRPIRRRPPARVDLHALRSISHQCDPALCRNSGSCCACYEIELSPIELAAAIGFLPQAARFAPRILQDDFFEEADDGSTVLATNDNGRCLFAFPKRGSGIFCALHAAALRAHIEPAAVKPVPCRLWPLALSDPPFPTLTVQDGVFQFPCNKPRPPDLPGLDPGIAYIIQDCFGPAFLHRCLNMLTKS